MCFVIIIGRLFLCLLFSRYDSFALALGCKLVTTFYHKLCIELDMQYSVLMDCDVITQCNKKERYIARGRFRNSW